MQVPRGNRHPRHLRVVIGRRGYIQFQHVGPGESTVHVGHKKTRHSAAEIRTVQLPQHRLEQMPLRKVDQHEIVRTDGDASRRLHPIADRAEIDGARKQREDTRRHVFATV